MQFVKKPVTIEAITFDDLVQYGLAADGANVVNGMPWSFTYKGHPITHENDDCYLIPTLEGTMRFERGDMLITGVKGEIYPCKADIFAMTYDAVRPAVADKVPSGPRVTADQVDALIVGEQYHVFPGTTVTVACVKVKNGFNVIGVNACVSAENWDEERGRAEAYAEAYSKIWELEAYLLRQKLANPTPAMPG